MHFTRSQIYKLPTMFKTTRTAQQTPPKPPIGGPNGQAAPLVWYWLPSPLAAEARAAPAPAPAPAPSVPVSVPCGCRGSTPSCRGSILRARLRSRRLQGIDTKRRRRLRRSPRRRGVDQPHRHQVARGSARYGDPPPLFPWIDPPPSPHLDRSVLGRLLLHRCVMNDQSL